MRISLAMPLVANTKIGYTKKQANNSENMSSTFLSATYPNNYYLMNFTARVNKDLTSFIERNKENLPHSVLSYVSNLSDEQKELISPLEAQRNAFEYLSICETVDDIKDAYSEEPLFKDLKTVGELKSKRGFLYDIRLMQDDLKEANETVLVCEDKDLTVYLVKKVFLEGKTIDEINQDLDNDLNPAFKKEENDKYCNRRTVSCG